MKVCIIGDGLTSLTLAKALTNQGVFVDIFSNQKFDYKNQTRTVGISKNNIDFFNKNILNIEKLLWNINQIEVYSENLNNERVLNFENNKERIFSIIKNHELIYNLLFDLKKNTFIKFKKKMNNYDAIKNKYKLIFNLDANNIISNKYFYKNFQKDYYSYAHTTIIDHEKKLKNNCAYQIFTKKGPIAFLPVSNNQTSVVYSARGKKNVDLESMINKYNNKYKIIKIKNKSIFELKSKDLRSYHHKNILAFGDLLHKLHPLAGQGFNMSIRDIKELLKLIIFKIDHGLDLDSSICSDFEKKTKHKNFIFTNSIDFIYEVFKFDSKSQNSFLSKSVQFFGKNKFINKIFSKVADDGIVY